MICGESIKTAKTQKSSATGINDYENAMALKTNHVDPVVGGVISADDQTGQRATGASGVGAAGSAANHD
jgi:hypothetical protein